MVHDTQQSIPLPESAAQPADDLQGCLLAICAPPSSREVLKRPRGRPVSLTLPHLALGVLFCMLRGWQSQLDLWRCLRFEGVGGLPRLNICDQTVYNWLGTQGMQAMGACFALVSQWVSQLANPVAGRTLAPFAREVLALDESTLDQMKRWLPALRGLPNGHDGLLAGRIAGLFDVRTQLWRRLDILPEARTNCKVHARAMLSGLLAGTLLLFDRGYFAFEWFDELTTAGFWWISRQIASPSYPVAHILLSQEGLFDALVWMGATSDNQAGYLVRLITYRYQGKWYSYVTNVLNPLVLPASEVVHLYARRWDIELAFRLLKDHLHLNLLWSAKWEVIGAQIWACLILAQLFHALQMQVAEQVDVEPFAVSLHLLVRHVPRWLAAGLSPIEQILRDGQAMGIIRPSTRHVAQLPEVCPQDLCFPPEDLPLQRPARYSHRPAGNRNRKKPDSDQPPSGKQEAKQSASTQSSGDQKPRAKQSASTKSSGDQKPKAKKSAPARSSGSQKQASTPVPDKPPGDQQQQALPPS
jgi:hypothetical protein